MTLYRKRLWKDWSLAQPLGNDYFYTIQIPPKIQNSFATEQTLS